VSHASPYLGGVRFDRGFRGLPGEFLKIDADGEGANYRTLSLQTDLWMGRARLQSSFREQALQAAYKICAVVITLESEHVEFQQ